jgi:hypothetical protein
MTLTALGAIVHVTADETTLCEATDDCDYYRIANPIVAATRLCITARYFIVIAGKAWWRGGNRHDMRFYSCAGGNCSTPQDRVENNPVLQAAQPWLIDAWCFKDVTSFCEALQMQCNCGEAMPQPNHGSASFKGAPWQLTWGPTWPNHEITERKTYVQPF